MKLLLSEKEIADYLMSLIDIKNILFPNKDYQYDQPHTQEAIAFTRQELDHPRFNLDKKRSKIKSRILRAVRDDLKLFVTNLDATIRLKRNTINLTIIKNLDTILEKLDEKVVLENYKKSNHQNFVKSVGIQIEPDSSLERVTRYKHSSESFLIRNTNANEILLIDRIKSKLPFWFIDAGYTNFIESHKKWHRLVANHLHRGKYFEAPVDRLPMFPITPRPWKLEGHYILVIEPGHFSAKIFGVDIPTWKKSIEYEIRKYTDRPIKFREKINKKIRKNLYQELCDEDYYSIINLNSNAAIEAIWAGVPSITLDQHISNYVTSNKISDINNLLRPNLANWLCMISYSQFTYEELINGTAYEIIKKYHV